MPTTQLPEVKNKAHEIAKKIANERPLAKDKDAPEDSVTGGFNQKSRPEPRLVADPAENSATKGDGQ